MGWGVLNHIPFLAERGPSVVLGTFGQGKWAPQDLPRAQGVSPKAISAQVCGAQWLQSWAEQALGSKRGEMMCTT